LELSVKVLPLEKEKIMSFSGGRKLLQERDVAPIEGKNNDGSEPCIGRHNGM
jgi:hypothetical protein